MILINDLHAHTSALRETVEQALRRVVMRGWFILGPEVNRCERQFARYLNLARCVSVANGTDALELALRAVGVLPGDKVGTVANAGMYATTASLAIGACPFFLDVDLDSRTMTLAECQRAVDAGVKAVVITHIYGRAAPELPAIAELCRTHNIPLVEDCAQAHGARLAGKMVGTYGDISCFSFYPTKNLGALGDGGAIATDNQDLADTVMRLRQYGWSKKYEVSLVGARNSRLDEMQAAILSEFLPLLDGWNQRRREIARFYSTYITHGAVTLPVFDGDDYVAHLYVIRSADPAALRVYLKGAGIASEVHYPIPDHRQLVLAGAYQDTSLPNTEHLAREILTLPCYPELTDEQIRQVVEAVNSWPA